MELGPLTGATRMRETLRCYTSCGHLCHTEEQKKIFILYWKKKTCVVLAEEWMEKKFNYTRERERDTLDREFIKTVQGCFMQMTEKKDLS